MTTTFGVRFFALCLSTVTLLNLPAFCTTNEIDLVALSRNKADWPREVRLRDRLTVPLMIDGKEMGSVELPVGSTVQLVEVRAADIKVSYRGATRIIPVEATDLAARIAAAGQRQAALARENKARLSLRQKLTTMERGQGIPLWNPDNTLNKQGFDLLIGRLNTLNPSDVASWCAAMKAGSGEEVQRLDMALFLVKVADLYEGAVFQRQKSVILMARCRQVPSAAISAWKAILSSTSKEDLSRTQTLAYLVQVERLFPQGVFIEAESSRLLSRLRSIPPRQIAAWRNELKTDKLSSGLITILSDDSLFPGDAFQLDN